MIHFFSPWLLKRPCAMKAKIRKSSYLPGMPFPLKIGQKSFIFGIHSVGVWCSGITPAQYAGGPGFKSQYVHYSCEHDVYRVFLLDYVVSKMWTKDQRFSYSINQMPDHTSHEVWCLEIRVLIKDWACNKHMVLVGIEFWSSDMILASSARGPGFNS